MNIFRFYLNKFTKNTVHMQEYDTQLSYEKHLSDIMHKLNL